MASARQSRLRRYTKRPGIMPGLEKVWWALRDSNPEPRDYESIYKTGFKCGNVNISVDSSG